MPVLVSHSKKSTVLQSIQTRLLASLTPQQSVATARWDSNKTTLTKFFLMGNKYKFPLSFVIP